MGITAGEHGIDDGFGEVTKQRLYLETMGTVLPRVGRKIILDKDASGVLPLLNLGGAQDLLNGGKR